MRTQSAHLGTLLSVPTSTSLVCHSAYITEAQPNEIHWLTFDEAEQNGIEVHLFPSG